MKIIYRKNIKVCYAKKISLFFSIILLVVMELTMSSFITPKEFNHNNRIFEDSNNRWPIKKVNKWYDGQPWPVGINYIVSTAVNSIEMWQKDTFDPKTIDKELGWAEDLGFNTIRIFLPDLLWEADSSAFIKRIDKVLDICEEHKMKAIVTFFTNGGLGEEPHLGKQMEPIPGVHNSRGQQSPGVKIVNDSTHAEWRRLEKYVKGVINKFKEDSRILMWCLYNEPENDVLGANSMPLLKKTFEWARSINPSQPLTSPIMLMPCEAKTRLDIVSFLGENCDVITFHSYSNEEYVKKFIRLLKPFNRPIICEEYMGRPTSTFEKILPILKKENVGAISWGLVAGKCNFYFPWNSKGGTQEPKIWFHDIFRQSGTPYDPWEIELVKKLTGKSK